MTKTRFGNYHESGYRPPRRWTVEERLADMEQISKLIERGGHIRADLARLRLHIEALRGAEITPEEIALAEQLGPPDFLLGAEAFEAENGPGAFAELYRIAKENTRG